MRVMKSKLPFECSLSARQIEIYRRSVRKFFKKRKNSASIKMKIEKFPWFISFLRQIIAAFFGDRSKKGCSGSKKNSFAIRFISTAPRQCILKKITVIIGAAAVIKKSSLPYSGFQFRRQEEPLVHLASFQDLIHQIRLFV